MTQDDSHSQSQHLPESDPSPDQGPQGPTTPTTTPTDTPAPGGAHFSTAATRPHGTGTRGEMLSRQSDQFEGRFGRMFRTLPAAVHTEADLATLATAMIAGPENAQIPEDAPNPEDNLSISAGYTYFGQFLDHDITFDPASSLQRQNDPDGLVDYRSPRFDLDSLYGRGPDDQPYLYQPDGIRMRLGRVLTGVQGDGQTRDLPRTASDEGNTGPARALIGDPRNDENVIVSQLHATMLRFHNRVADLLAETTVGKLTFEAVQRTVRFHYQWVILHDFLPKIVGQKLVDRLCFEGQGEASSVTSGTSVASAGKTLLEKPKLKFFKWRNAPYIPVEFSVAAYRFGHSMVRPSYRLNSSIPRLEILSPDGTSGLSGFHAFPSSWAVDWKLFFPLTTDAPVTGADRVQASYRIDTLLADPLARLPGVQEGPPSLANRNLLRGLRMQLPSGQAVARAIKADVLADDQLLIGVPTPGRPERGRTLVDLSPAFTGNAPLWAYILAEAQHTFKEDSEHSRLGPVGARIVAEVFIGLLYGDPHSFIRQDPTWEPLAALSQGRIFDLSALVRAVREPVT